MMYNSFTEMPVWEKAHNLAIEVFELTVELPRSEDYGLTSQIRKSSNGAPACIAEGFGRSTKKDKSNFYIIPEVHHSKLKIIFYMGTKLVISTLSLQIDFFKSIIN